MSHHSSAFSNQRSAINGRFFFSLLAAYFFFASCLYAGEAKLTEVSGVVEIIRPATIKSFAAIKGLPVQEGDVVKTASGASAKMKHEDGSDVQIRENSQIEVEATSSEGIGLKLAFGKMKAWVSKLATRRRFEVKTPSALCAVRGTEFSIEVAGDKSSVSVEEGAVGFARLDGVGGEVLVGEGQRSSVVGDRPPARPVFLEGRSPEAQRARAEARREVGLDMTKEQIQSAAAQEMKLAEYQEGKALIDVNGLRVRLEEYIVRPTPNEFKLVVLNTRENRFDYFFYRSVFNKDLPTDLSLALRDLSGKIGAPPEWFQTSYQTGRSNTVDKIEEAGSGGHLVDVNSNTSVSDDVTAVFDPDLDVFRDLKAGESFYKTLFNNYTYKINDITKQTYKPKAGVTNLSLDPFVMNTEVDFAFAGGGVFSLSEFPSEGQLHNRIQVFYGDGTSEEWNSYIISDEGKIAKFSDFDNITSGTDYKKRLLLWNFEQVITASEFQGRTIDIVVEPKILIRSGLIK